MANLSKENFYKFAGAVLTKTVGDRVLIRKIQILSKENDVIKENLLQNMQERLCMLLKDVVFISDSCLPPKLRRLAIATDYICMITECGTKDTTALHNSINEILKPMRTGEKSDFQLHHNHTKAVMIKCACVLLRTLHAVYDRNATCRGKVEPTCRVCKKQNFVVEGGASSEKPLADHIQELIIVKYHCKWPMMKDCMTTVLKEDERMVGVDVFYKETAFAQAMGQKRIKNRSNAFLTLHSFQSLP